MIEPAVSLWCEQLQALMDKACGFDSIISLKT